MIPFSFPHVHRFVNQYEAILNCQATCESKNCIYVLTCPCGQFDFIGESKVSFAETMICNSYDDNIYTLISFYLFLFSTSRRR